jgi:tetratricopeptide (TPR) repeat protein
MAPEQAVGKKQYVGPGVDIYALGAILYRLLAGRPPFKAETADDTLAQVRDQEPLPLRRLQPNVPADLEAICLKCLEREPGRRYLYAADLVNDLRRFLADEPVGAYPLGFWTLTRKWLVRRRWRTAAVVAVVATVATLVSIGAWLHDRWQTQLDAVAQQRLHAQSRARLSWQALDDMYQQAESAWLTNQPQYDATEREFLQKALTAFQDSAATDHADPAADQRQLGALRRGHIYRALEQPAEAEKAFTHAIALGEALHADSTAEFRYLKHLADSYNGLGELCLANQRRLPEAEQLHRKALEMCDRLVTQVPKEPIYQRQQARSFFNLGKVYRQTERPAPAETYDDLAISVFDALSRQAPSESAYRLELSRCYLERGRLFHDTERPDKAAADFRRAIEYLENLKSLFHSKPILKYELALTHHVLGNHLADWAKSASARHSMAEKNTRLQQAVASQLQARTLLQELAADNPDRPIYQEQLAKIQRVLDGLRASAAEKK